MFEWLSGFMLNPAMAIGTGAVASPILIHILSKRRFRRIRWAAMSFLLEARRRNRRRVRLEQLLLLLLRCLAVFLLALLMTRPFLRPGLLSSILGAAARTERIILLDDSYSMDHRPASGTGPQGQPVFEHAKQAAVRIARWVSGETPADSVTLFVTSRPREPVLALPSLSEENLQRFRERLGTLNTSQTTARIADGIGAVADLVRRSPTQANAAVYVISDFQRKDWAPPVDPTAEQTRSVVAPLGDLAKAGHSIKLVLVNVGDPSAGNVAVTDIVAVQPQIVAGVPARFIVSVVNHSADPLEQINLGVSVAHHRMPPVTIPSIQPGQTVREPVEITFSEEGSDYVRIRLAGAAVNADTPRLDNTRALAVEVVPAVQVLLVDGEANNDPYRDEVYLLRAALRPAGRAASGNELAIVDEEELEDLELGGYHVIVLANVRRWGQAARRHIEAFVRDGGGLIIFAGDQLDIEHYNRNLYRGGRGLLPLPLIETVEPQPNTEPIGPGAWDAAHPVMRAFVNQLADALRRVRVSSYIRVGESAAAPAASRPSDDNAAAERAPARIVVRFNDADASPAIIQRGYGRGLCVFIATSADQEWNNWPSNFSYLPVMLELVQYAAKRSDGAKQTVVGGEISCPLDRSLFAGVA
ncbi:MAG: BatA domain-containing protein, partial [Phycisphaerae bacterium]